MLALRFLPQAHMASKIGLKLFPESVTEYSTRGGISANANLEAYCSTQ